MRKRTAFILILLLGLFLTACKREDDKADDSTVNVYYIDSKSSGLVSESYTLIGTGRNDQIKELIYMLQKKPANAVYKNALPKTINVNSSYDKSGSLLIDFSSAYSDMSNVDKILCCAAIVKTLSQIPDVNYFQFNIGGQPLPESDGIARSLTAQDFISNSEVNISYKVKLFFANKEGDELVEFITNIDNSGEESIEELVLQQLINGPAELGMYSTVPEGTVLLNVSKSDNICTVDFNEKFLNKLPEVTEEVVIYSVVNSLIDLPNINKVQFTINGKTQKTYWEDIDFSSTFEQNLDLIGSKE